MSNGQQCCAAGVCCPPSSPKQREALAAMMEMITTQFYVSPDHTKQIADWLLDHFDIGPKGSMDFTKAATLAVGKH